MTPRILRPTADRLDPRRGRRRATALWLLLLIGVGGCDAGPRSAISPGRPLPDLRVEGWLQGEIPSWQSLKGKVIVIAAWAYW